MELNINLNSLRPRYEAGRMFEANVTELKITVSDDFIKDADYYLFEFEGESLSFASKPIELIDGTASLLLPEACTQLENIGVVLSAYKNGSDIAIMKSEIINLHFEKSIKSDGTPAPEVDGFVKEIVKLIENGKIKGDKGDTGAPGKDGVNGIDGKDGAPGKDGYTPIKGVDYFDGEKGDKGDKGEKGDRGEKGEQGVQGLPGTTVYSELTDKPSINNVTLEGNKTLGELGINIPTKLTDLDNDGTFIENDDYASYSRAGIVQLSVGGGLNISDKGILTAAFPIKEVTSKTDDIAVTHGSGTYTLEFNSERYAKSADIAAKQDKLTAGENIKIENNVISLDIPTATANTTYGGGAK